MLYQQEQVGPFNERERGILTLELRAQTGQEFQPFAVLGHLARRMLPGCVRAPAQVVL